MVGALASGEWGVRSPASGLRPVAHEALACSASGAGWPEPGSGREPGEERSGHWTVSAGVGSVATGCSVCHSAQCQAGGGGWSQCHYHWHLSSPCSVQCQCQEPRVSGDPSGVRVSGVTVSFPDIRVCLGNWSKVGWCGIGDMLSLCFMSDRHASITDSESPALPVQSRGRRATYTYIQIHENNEETFTLYYSFIKLILAPDVCYIRPRLLVVCSGHLHISVSPPSLGMIPWTVIM